MFTNGEGKIVREITKSERARERERENERKRANKERETGEIGTKRDGRGRETYRDKYSQREKRES